MRINTFFNTHKKTGILFILLTPLFLALVLSFGLGYRVFINTTYSLPHTFYIANPNKTVFKRGDYIAFTHSISPKVIIKKIIGLEGDAIMKEGNSIRVQGNTNRLPLKEMRTDGSPLTPVMRTAVTKNTVFVAGSHESSFDSRYFEFGLVPLSSVRGQVWPIF